MASPTEQPAELSPQLRAREKATRAHLNLVAHRATTHPTPYRDYAEHLSARADAYDARAAFWRDAIGYATRHPRTASSLLFDAMLDAQSGNADRANEDRRDARRWARAYPDTDRATGTTTTAADRISPPVGR